MTSVVAAIFIVAVIAGLVLVQRRANARLVVERRRTIEPLLGLLTEPRVEERAGTYPAVVGTFAGRTVSIELHADAIAVRKLPALWLFVSVARTGRQDGVLSLMRRRRNTEYWSPFDELPFAVPVPSDCPADTVAAASNAGSTALLERIAGLGPWLRRETSKEVLIRPRSVRLCELAAEGQRGAYLIYRQSNFEDLRLDLGSVRVTLAAAMALAGQLDNVMPATDLAAASQVTSEARALP